MSIIVCTFFLGACDLGKVTVGTTAKVLKRAQPALQQESDYDLAARALPGTLKTVEGFWFVDQDNELLTGILAEGFCQYGTGFVEDEWEIAEIERRLDDAAYQAARATKMFIRCTNYGLRLLGKKWQENLYGDLDTVKAMVAKIGMGKRDALMWTAIGLASTINYNKDNVELIAQLPTARLMLERVIELDDKHDYQNRYKRAIAHVAMGLVHTSLSEALGGQPKLGEAHFRRALEITDGKLLLAKVYLARRFAVITQNRDLFHKTLIEVLQTPPSIWPEQRLANEIAHRRARRYLKHESDWF